MELSQLDAVRETTQKRLNLEEQERTMNSLKLDYLVNNNRKLQLQKRFLEKSLENDLKTLKGEMRKTETEMQLMTFIPSKEALVRLREMYTVVTDSLGYVREVVQYMNFDLGDQVHGKLQERNPDLDLPPRRESVEVE